MDSSKVTVCVWVDSDEVVDAAGVELESAVVGAALELPPLALATVGEPELLEVGELVADGLDEFVSVDELAVEGAGVESEFVVVGAALVLLPLEVATVVWVVSFDDVELVVEEADEDGVALDIESSVD